MNSNAMQLKGFMDDLFTEVFFAIKDAKDIQNRIFDSIMKQDAKQIEDRLMGVAANLAKNGIRSKKQWEAYLKTIHSGSRTA